METVKQVSPVLLLKYHLKMKRVCHSKTSGYAFANCKTSSVDVACSNRNELSLKKSMNEDWENMQREETEEGDIER